jgi:hypothetical protein
MDTDTLPHWLYVRFGKGPIAWHELAPGEQDYWTHEAAAVRRAVARGGFKQPEPAANDYDMHADDMAAERDYGDPGDDDRDED